MQPLRILSRTILVPLLLICGVINAQDWPGLNHYRTANSLLGPSEKNETRVVFMGNSITESWGLLRPEYFTGNPYINRGISGQTSPQMLARFRSDVINLDPDIVILLAGTNDIAGNTGPITLEEILGNIISMTELARANQIDVILASVLPAKSFSWRPKLHPADDIISLNSLLNTYAESEGFVFLDYHTAMVDAENGLADSLSHDGVHPNIAGYKIMEVLAEKALAELKSRQD